MKKYLFILLIAGGIFACGSPCEHKTCKDFDTQEEAQKAFDSDKDCYKNLDRDKDGKACESLP